MIDDPALAVPSRPNRALNTIVGLVVGAGLGLVLGLLIGRDVVFQVLIGGALGAVVGALWHGPGLPSPPPPLARGERASLTSLADVFARALHGPTRTAFRACLVLFIPGASVLFTLLVLVDARLSSYMSAASIAVGVVLLVAVMVVLPPLLLDRSMRSAFAVLEWCGAHEWRRLAGSARAAASFPVTPEARQRWLTERFDPASPRAIDIEVLLLEGDVDTARGATAKLPTETPQDRFVKAEREEFVRYQESGEVDWTGLRDAAAAIPPGLDRVAAEASVSSLQARTRLPHDDWLVPLLAARTTIPESDTVILLRDYSWPAFSIALVKLLPVAMVFILGFLLLDRLG